MVEDYVVRDDEVDLMHDVKTDMSLEDLIDVKIAEIAQLGERHTLELQNLIDFILHPHSLDEITRYARELRHKLQEDEA